MFFRFINFAVILKHHKRLYKVSVVLCFLYKMIYCWRFHCHFGQHYQFILHDILPSEEGGGFVNQNDNETLQLKLSRPEEMSQKRSHEQQIISMVAQAFQGELLKSRTSNIVSVYNIYYICRYFSVYFGLHIN